MVMDVVDNRVDKKPADVVEEKRKEKILVDTHSLTGELFKDTEYDKRDQETNDRHYEEENVKSVDIVDDTNMVRVHTVGVVTPGSVGVRMDEPRPILRTVVFSQSLTRESERGKVGTEGK